ncbi:MAG: hypothetical protein ACK56W_02430 [Pirellula sp.]|nr:HPF/RaiA family ribosome-associated protein [Pirellula sp.]
MQLFIYAHGIDLSESVIRQTHQKLQLALDRLEEHIETIHVYLVDNNGPLLGGIDKLCRIVVQVRKQECIEMEDIDSRMDAAIDRLTDRLGVAASKRAETLLRHSKPARRWLGFDDSIVFGEKD